MICNKKSTRQIKVYDDRERVEEQPACLQDDENNVNDSPRIDKETLELNMANKIIEQMKQCVCKIEKENDSGTGFFCMIPFPDIKHKLPVLITSYSILKENDVISGRKIKLLLFDKSYKIINIDNNRKIYISNEIKDNITIIEIKDKDGFNYNEILQIDKGIYNERYLKFIYRNKSIYSIFFSQNSDKVKYDINIITNIDSDINKFLHLCSNEEGALGAPILNLENYDVMGINIGNNLGTLLKGPIRDFYQLIKIKNNNEINELTLTLNINKDDVDKTIYFLDNTEYKDYENNKYHYHDNLKELNNENTKLYINEKEFPYSKFFRPNKVGLYTIRLEFEIQLTDCSYMFYYCYSIVNIDFSFFDTSKVTNMSCMFALCLNIMDLDLSYLDTSNVTNMNNMFYSCKNISELDLSFFKTKNVLNMSRMFSECSDLKFLNLKHFNTKNVRSMSHMFFLCKNLNDLDLSFFDTSNVMNMNNMFYFCKNLRVLDLKSFNTEKVFDMSKMFYLCLNLSKVNVSSFDTKNVINMSYMFSDCKHLLTLDLSNFDTRKVIDISHFLSGCDLTRIDLSNFNTINVSNMSFMFYFCKNCKSINVSSFNTKNVKNMSYMFSECRYLRQIDLSSFNIDNAIDMKSMFDGCIKNIKIKVNQNSIEKFKIQNDRYNFYI